MPLYDRSGIKSPWQTDYLGSQGFNYNSSTGQDSDGTAGWSYSGDKAYQQKRTNLFGKSVDSYEGPDWNSITQSTLGSAPAGWGEQNWNTKAGKTAQGQAGKLPTSQLQQQYLDISKRSYLGQPVSQAEKNFVKQMFEQYIDTTKSGSFGQGLVRGGIGMAKTLATNPAVLGALGGYMLAPEMAAGSAVVGGGEMAASSLFPSVAPVAGAPTIGGAGAFGTTSLGGGALTSVAPEFSAWSAGAGGLGSVGGIAGGANLLDGANDWAGEFDATSGGGSNDFMNVADETTGGIDPYPAETAPSTFNEGAWAAGGPGEAATGATGALGSGFNLADAGKFIKEWGPLASSAFGLYGSIGAKDRLGDEQARLNAAFDRSDPFAEARRSAGDQYLEWQQDPSKYMSSPIARLQIDEMNREAQRKNAMLGQTWNVDNSGNIRGSGTGANEFAKQLQFNLAKQYEQALGNRAQQAGMSLFPNQEISRQLSQNAASQQGVQRDMYGNIIGLAGSLGDLYSSGKMNDLYSKFFGA